MDYPSPTSGETEKLSGRKKERRTNKEEEYDGSKHDNVGENLLYGHHFKSQQPE
jgi:hypothetical protein